MNGTAQVQSGTEKSAVRRLSAPLTIGIVLLPLIFSWFVLREGYSHKARAFGVGWVVLCLLTSIIIHLPATEVQKGSARSASRAVLEPAAKPKMVVQAVAPAAPVNRRDESRYIEMLDDTVSDLRKEGFIRQEDNAQTTWAVAVQTMGNVASMYPDAANYDLTAKGREARARFMNEIPRLQAKDFPRIRALQAQALSEKLWQHDITVEARGAGNSSLLFTGIIFGANYNIQKVMEAVLEDALAVRAKRLEFRAYKGDRTTYYEIKPLSDTAVATFSFNRWTPVE